MKNIKTLFFICSILFSSAVYGKNLTLKDIRLIDDFIQSKHYSKSMQLIMITKDETLDYHRGTANTYQRYKDKWFKVFDSIPVVFGKNGLAKETNWSEGKKEGDGKTPVGVYPLLSAFGYAQRLNTKLPYVQAKASDIWVNDVTSNLYNKWSSLPTTAKNYEKMLRKDNLYKWGVVIGYNMDPIVKGKGSAIFIHRWLDQSKGTTEGCLAMSEVNLISILGWLDPAKEPVIMIQ